jgi:hypothetical protein
MASHEDTWRMSGFVSKANVCNLCSGMQATKEYDACRRHLGPMGDVELPVPEPPVPGLTMDGRRCLPLKLLWLIFMVTSTMPMDRDLDMCELFAGAAAVSRGCHRLGMKYAHYDITHHDGHDINTPKGFLQGAQRTWGFVSVAFHDMC